MEEFGFMKLEKFVRVVGTKQSGVYLIRDKGNRIVYVGKAVDLKSRIRDHFNGHTNTQVYSVFFYEVAVIIENSSIKRSMIETNLMFEYKPVFNKEVQEEFPDLYNEYLRDNSGIHQNIPAVKDALEEKRRREERHKKDKLRDKVISTVGDKALFYDIVSFLDNGYNPHFLSRGLNIELEIIRYIQKNRKEYRIPKTHKRTIKTNDLIYSLTGKKGKINKRLDHLL